MRLRLSFQHIWWTHNINIHHHDKQEWNVDTKFVNDCDDDDDDHYYDDDNDDCSVDDEEDNGDDSDDNDDDDREETQILGFLCDEQSHEGWCSGIVQW